MDDKILQNLLEEPEATLGNLGSTWCCCISLTSALGRTTISLFCHAHNLQLQTFDGFR